MCNFSGNKTMENSNNPTPKTQKSNSNKKIDFRSIYRVTTRFAGRLFGACLVLVVAAHFVPELRESMPQLYLFVEDVVFGVVNWGYGLINKIIL